jgi:hypothetical protein
VESNKNLTHIITFTLGDPSGDGSGLKEDWRIKTTHSAKEIDDALRKFKDEFGIDIQDICSDYQCSTIYSDEAEILVKQGIIDKDGLDKNGDYYVDGDSDFVSIAMMMVKHYIPEFDWSHYTDDNEEQCLQLEGAGYGLYCL